MAAASGAWQAMGHQQWPRRALLQNRDRPAFSSVNNLLVFTGLLVGLAVAIMAIGCMCGRYRRRRRADIRQQTPAPQQPQQQELVLWQQAKLVRLPVLVLSPDNQVSYARKLVSAGDKAAPVAAPGNANDGSGSTAVASPISVPIARATMLVAVPPAAAVPAASETQRQQSAPAALESVVAGDTSAAADTASAGQPGQPPAAAALAAATAEAAAATAAPASSLPEPCDSSAAAAAAGAASAAQAACISPAGGVSAVAAAQGSDAASLAGSPAAGVSRPSLQTRIYRGFQQWHDGNTARALQAHELQLLRLQRHMPTPATAQEPEPQVRIMPAFIEWDVTSGDGPILHPPPLPPPDPTRAAAVARAEAALLARAGSGGSSGGGSSRGSFRLWRASFRVAEALAHGGDGSSRDAGSNADAGSGGDARSDENAAGAGEAPQRPADERLPGIRRHSGARRPSIHNTSAPPRMSRLSMAVEAAADSDRVA